MQTRLKHSRMVIHLVPDHHEKFSLEKFSFHGPWAICCNTESVYAHTSPDLKLNKCHWLEFSVFPPLNAQSSSNVLNIPWPSDSLPLSLLSPERVPFVTVLKVFDPCQMNTIFQTHDWASHLVSSFLNYTNQTCNSSFPLGFFIFLHFNFFYSDFLNQLISLASVCSPN